jgi:hypothetical protein
MSNFLRSRRDDRGVVALEVVIAMPFILMLILGAVYLGNFLNVRAQTINLARQGARAAALHQPLPSGTSVVGAACPTPNDPTTYVTVQATKDLTLDELPFIGIHLDKDGDGLIKETETMRCGG